MYRDLKEKKRYQGDEMKAQLNRIIAALFFGVVARLARFGNRWPFLEIEEEGYIAAGWLVGLLAPFFSSVSMSNSRSCSSREKPMVSRYLFVPP